MKRRQEPSVVFTAMSRRNFCFRMFITKYALNRGKIPISTFTLFDYFLLDTVSREFLIESNNVLVRRADELWVFGPISDGVQAEIAIAREAKKPIRYFTIHPPNTIKKIKEDEAAMEE